jgi:signal transduction histidine kinase/ActR/RegA family two-component response regulator
MPFVRTALTAIGGIVIAIGLAIWAGWIFQVMPLVTFGGPGTPLSPNAAVAFVAAGVGLLATVRDRAKGARIAASLIGVVALLALLQIATGHDAALDRGLWFKLAAGSMSPPPMPFFVALALLVAAVAIALVAAKKPRLALSTAVSGWLLLMALLGLFSFLITLKSEQAWSAYHGVGLPFSLGLALLALGLLTWIGSHWGELGVTCCLMATAMAVVLAIGSTTRQSLAEFRESNTWVARTLEAELAIDQLQRMLASPETLARSEAISPVDSAAEISAQWTAVRSLIKEHPEQQERLRALQPWVDARIRGSATPLSLDGVALLTDLRASERARRTLAFSEIAQTEINTKLLQSFAGTAAAIMVGLAFWLAWRAVLVRQSAEGALLEARDQALEHSRLKSEFLANMSHEIRTPMNGVIGMTSLLAETPISAEQREYVETIRVSGETLLILINDILDFSKIESGRLELEEHEFDIVTCLEETLVLFRAKAREKNIDLSYTVDASVPRVVVGDVTRVRQVAANLVSNAIKFTPKGEIEISVRRLEGPLDASCLLAIQVRDTGIGIPEEKRHRLFRPFTQVEASTNRRFGGTGLGLSISRRLSELMGGTLTVQSVEGKGSTFEFTIRVGVAATRHSISATPWAPPVVAVATAAAAPVEIAEALPSFRILLAEDNSTNQLVAHRMLAKLGHRADTVANGQEVLDLLPRQPVDIILMDVQMPGIDGIEATQRLRRDPALKQPWIIAMTANAMTGDRERCLAAGMNDYVSKPVKLEELRNALSRASFNLADKQREDRSA